MPRKKNRRKEIQKARASAQDRTPRRMRYIEPPKMASDWRDHQAGFAAAVAVAFAAPHLAAKVGVIMGTKA